MLTWDELIIQAFRFLKLGGWLELQGYETDPLSIGVAWLVIVAAEMLTGGVGIGFWVWDEWNNLNVEHILIAIFVVGIVGLLLEQAILLLARRFNYA